MALSTQPYKGSRDFYPEDKRLQKWLFSTWREVCERYGYEEYDAPILEPTELFLQKGNQEIIDQQTYSFIDRGERPVTIRTEMTPSVSRMVAARRQELSYPLRWYSIPNLWRYERPQRGRLREFWQLNVDLFGVAGLSADQEVIMLANDIMRAFGAKPTMYAIRINSRELTNRIMHDVLGLDTVQSGTVIRLLDHMHKHERAEFLGMLDQVFSPSQREAGKVQILLDLLEAESIDQLPPEILQLDAAQALSRLLALLGSAGITNGRYDPTLMRGFDYYTGIVFEVFDTHPDNNRSIFGGGRYDGLVGNFGVEPVPTFGFGMGDVPLQNFLETHNLLPGLTVETELYAALLGDVYERALPELTALREMGVNLAVDLSNRKADKQIKTAVKKNIPYVLFVGEAELDSGQYTLRHLSDGHEEQHSLQRIVSIIKDRRH